MDVESDAAVLASHQATARNYVKFYPKWERNNFESKKQGIDVGEYRDFVLIISPGQAKSEVHRQVQEKDKTEYPTEWAAYKAGKEQRLSGTPIESLPGLAQSRADALKALYVYTIEQLSDLSEPAKRAVGMDAGDLVQRAQAYLQKNNTEVHRLSAELQAEREARQREREEFAQRIAALEAGMRKKPGRKPKVQQAIQ